MTVKKQIAKALEALATAQDHVVQAEALQPVDTRKQELRYDRLIVADDLLHGVRQLLQTL